MSLFDMTGKVAIITGSSRGIGKATAEAMAEHGAKVVISSRKQDACDAIAAEINAKFGDGTAIAVAANISSKDELQNLVDETRAAFGKITVLVCNAASNPYYGPGRDQDDQFRKIMDNNILSNHWLIPMVAPEMLERGEGSIIIVSSIGGLKDRRSSAPTAFPRPPTCSWRAIWRVEFGAARRAGQLHRAGADPDRLRPRVVGKSGDAERDQRARARCAGSASRPRSPAPWSISPAARPAS